MSQNEAFAPREILLSDKAKSHGIPKTLAPLRGQALGEFVGHK